MAEMQVANNQMLALMQNLYSGGGGSLQMTAALQQMTNTQQFLSLDQHCLHGDSVFDGSPQKYIAFMNHFLHRVFKVVHDPQWRYDILLKSCIKEPNEIGRIILQTGGDIETKLKHFLNALSNRYGSVDKIAHEMIREVRRHCIENHDFETHIKYYTKLKNVYETTSNFGFSHEFDTAKSIGHFLKKTPQ